MSATAAVKSRLDRFNSGEWRELWHDAHEHPELNRLLKARRGAQSGQAAQHAKLARAKHYALNGQLRDARQCLTDSGLLSFFEPGIQQKMHALFEDCADGGEPIMDAPGDIGDDDCWGFEISEMWVKMREGPMMTVPTLPYVMKHLPRCKGKGPCGDVYEHYQAMPQDLVHDMCHRALNGRISEGFATLWRSGLLHIGDKERLDSRGLKDGRPITVGLALRRITGRIPCAQLKYDFAKLFSSVRQLGIAVPSGIEAAFHTVELAIDYQQRLADGDNALMPTPVEIDFSDAFTRAHRSPLFRNTRDYVPTLLRYMYTMYGGEGTMWGVENGAVVFQSRCNSGVWQGDPLGAQCMGLAILDFCKLLIAKLRPGSAFELPDEMHARPSGTPHVWIIDDLTCMPRQYEVIELIDFVLEMAPRYGLYPNMPKFHVWITGKPDDNHELIQALQARGVQFSFGGLKRLLGAPIGTPSFCAQPGGHLDSVVAKASSLIEQVLQIDHAQAQYHLLRFCATDSLQHCARLKSPWLLSGFASRHREEIQGAISKVLYAETLTDTQRVLLGLPEYCGGLACTTTHDIMDAAYLGATGSVARFFSNCDWPEAKSLLHVIPLRPEYQSVVARVNNRFHDEQDWVKRLRFSAGGQHKASELRELDPIKPQDIPAQKVIARATHRLVALELADKLERHDPVMASWLHSCSLPGAGAWLHSSPAVHRFRVSSEVFRTMLCIRLGASIPSAVSIKRCVVKCDYSGPSLQNGRHFFSQCNKQSYNGIRHNTVVSALRTMLKRAGFEVIIGETADWLVGAPERRPFDLCFRAEASRPWQGIDVGVADPTRHSYLPTGSKFFKRAQAAERYAGKKQGKYNRLLQQFSLKKKVEFAAVLFEVSGGFSASATSLFDSITAAASKNGAQLAAGEWSWSAMDFSSFYTQVLSFEINKLTALAVLNGLREAAAAAAPAAI